MNIILRLFTFILKCYLFLYVLGHILFFSSPDFAKILVIQNFVNYPFGNLSDPKEFGYLNVYNFYLNTGEEAKIGVWHFIPAGLEYWYSEHAGQNVKAHFEAFLKESDDRPILIYAHGSDRNRAASSRVALCNKLVELDVHVFALDYRGYGDSTGNPTETGLVNDIIELYKFLKLKRPNADIFMWGHSMGAAVTLHAAKKLSYLNDPPNGIILEAPFLNLHQACKDISIAPFFYNNPWIINITESNLAHMDVNFKNDENIVEVNSKILIFHAEDDSFIPHERGIELLNRARAKRPSTYPHVELKILDKSHGLGHSSIYLHDEIYPIVRKFILATDI